MVVELYFVDDTDSGGDDGDADGRHNDGCGYFALGSTPPCCSNVEYGLREERRNNCCCSY